MAVEVVIDTAVEEAEATVTAVEEEVTATAVEVEEVGAIAMAV